jgi:D-alanyl-D-alanine carboxypeptidase
MSFISIITHSRVPCFALAVFGAAFAIPSASAQITITSTSAVALQSALDNALPASLASGGTAAIVSHGEVLWHGQSGVIAPGSTTAVTADTLFAYASAGKMMTATLTLGLVDQGKLTLDDPIAAYLPAGVPGASEVTVRQLLNHTSGYGDVYAVPSVQERLTDQNYPWTRSQLITEVVAPETKPGTVHSYSNTNFILLGEVIEKAGRQSFATQFQNRIVEPLGLSRLFVTPQPRGEFAQGVLAISGEDINLFDLTTGVPTALYGETFGDGPAVGNAADLGLFLDALVNGQLLSEASTAEMLNFDPESNYGLGIGTYTDELGTWIGHAGSYGGYTSLAFYNPNLDLTLATLANHAGSLEVFEAQVLAKNVIAAGAVPEPSTSAALVAGGAFVLVCLRRRRHAAVTH